MAAPFIAPIMLIEFPWICPLIFLVFRGRPIAVVSFGAEREIWLKDKRGFKCIECDSGWVQSARPHAPIHCAFCNGKGFTAAPPNAKQPMDQRVLLQTNSLFIMPIGYQDNYLHRIPKHDRPCGWRISLTFRSFYPQN